MHERARIFISNLKLNPHYLTNSEYEPDRIFAYDGVVDECAPLCGVKLAHRFPCQIIQGCGDGGVLGGVRCDIFFQACSTCERLTVGSIEFGVRGLAGVLVERTPLVFRNQRFDLLVFHRRAAAGMFVCVFMVALPNCVFAFRVRRPRFTPIPRPTPSTFQPGGEQPDFR